MVLTTTMVKTVPVKLQKRPEPTSSQQLKIIIKYNINGRNVQRKKMLQRM